MNLESLQAQWRLADGTTQNLQEWESELEGSPAWVDFDSSVGRGERGLDDEPSLN